MVTAGLRAALKHLDLHTQGPPTAHLCQQLAAVKVRYLYIQLLLSAMYSACRYAYADKLWMHVSVYAQYEGILLAIAWLLPYVTLCIVCNSLMCLHVCVCVQAQQLKLAAQIAAVLTHLNTPTNRPTPAAPTDTAAASDVRVSHIPHHVRRWAQRVRRTVRCVAMTHMSNQAGDSVVRDTLVPSIEVSSVRAHNTTQYLYTQSQTLAALMSVTSLCVRCKGMRRHALQGAFFMSVCMCVCMYVTSVHAGLNPCTHTGPLLPPSHTSPTPHNKQQQQQQQQHTASQHTSQPPAGHTHIYRL